MMTCTLHVLSSEILCRGRVSFFRSTDVQAKFRPSTLHCNDTHFDSLLPCDWLNELTMVEISSFRRTLVHRCFKRNLNDLGFRR